MGLWGYATGSGYATSVSRQPAGNDTWLNFREEKLEAEGKKYTHEINQFEIGKKTGRICWIIDELEVEPMIGG